MFKGACRLDDSVHRTIILLQHFQVKKFRLRSEDYRMPYLLVVRTLLEGLFLLNARKGVVRPTGLEPVTPRSEVWCSIQLSYGRMADGSDEIIDKRAGVSIRPLVLPLEVDN